MGYLPSRIFSVVVNSSPGCHIPGLHFHKYTVILPLQQTPIITPTENGMHHYTRMTGPAIEKQIAVMNEKAANASGMPGYERLNSARKALLQKIEGMRPPPPL